MTPVRELSDLALSDTCRKATDQMIGEQHRSSLLCVHGLDTRHRLLLGKIVPLDKVYFWQCRGLRELGPLRAIHLWRTFPRSMQIGKREKSDQNLRI